MRQINAFSSILLALFVFAIAVVVVIRGRQEFTTPPVAEPATPVTMDVRSVAPGPSSSTEPDPAAISASIATLCGADSFAADRYEARNDALRSIARERNLPADDVGALVSWLASTNDVLRFAPLPPMPSLVSPPSSSPANAATPRRFRFYARRWPPRAATP
ncbi:MAG: hypothetical protein IKO40_10150 [Kiritimatiellae bacterium]|nr:hypothetical protein [Kiritimatiellia bacterium]